MKRYIGTKLLNAIPMLRRDYNDFRGWDWPVGEDPEDDGYLVEYIDGGEPNTDQYEGYVSWSPAEVFENSYMRADGINFGLAIEAMRIGKKVSRAGWNGKDMFIFWVPSSTFKVNRPPLLGIYEEGTEINYHSHIDMKTADGMVVPWLASQTDMAALDWIIVED